MYNILRLFQVNRGQLMYDEKLSITNDRFNHWGEGSEWLGVLKVFDMILCIYRVQNCRRPPAHTRMTVAASTFTNLYHNHSRISSMLIYLEKMHCRKKYVRTFFVEHFVLYNFCLKQISLSWQLNETTAINHFAPPILTPRGRRRHRILPDF